MAALDTLEKLYVNELKDLYNAEQQILKALPKMIKAAAHPELKQAFSTHLNQTEGHVERLARIFEDLGTSPRGKKCHGMEGVIEEGAELIGDKPEPHVLDAGLISAAQHVEHYEMAGYGSVRSWADTLGLSRHVALLQQTLDEERKTDQLLTQLAARSINTEAATAGAADEDTTSTGALADRPAPKRTSSSTRTSARTDRTSDAR
jgi:ferritin-like metal-binding protein YciE